MAAVAFALGAALIAAAAAVQSVPFVGAIAAVALIALALVQFATAFWLTNQAYDAHVRAIQAENRVKALKEEFQAALDLARERCCPQCIFVDESMPC